MLACGANCCGQLGLGCAPQNQSTRLEYSREPQEVKGLAGCDIVYVACGSEHSVAVERGAVCVSVGVCVCVCRCVCVEKKWM